MPTEKIYNMFKGEHFHKNNPDIMLKFDKPDKAEIDEMNYKKPITVVYPSTVLTQIEGYTTLIAILGGPALLIIKDALDVWKQEQAEKTAFYKIKAQAVIDYNDAAQKQAQMIEAKQQDQEHKMENKK